jgi:HSP20 family molecular chaperone IbpA
MTLRPPRRTFSVSRRLSERARAAAQAEQPSDQPSAASGFTVDGVDGITGIVGALRGLVEQLAAAARQPGAEADSSDSGRDASGENAHTVTLGGGKARMVFGYTLRIGNDGISAEPFGNVPAETPAQRPEKRAGAAPAALQPIVEVYQDGDIVFVIAELPGADPARIVCQAEGARLSIEAAGARNYRKDLTLPVPVRPDSIVQSLQNGILEVRLTKAAAP